MEDKCSQASFSEANRKFHHELVVGSFSGIRNEFLEVSIEGLECSVINQVRSRVFCVVLVMFLLFHEWRICALFTSFSFFDLILSDCKLKFELLE